jgi:hypothetical protein
MNQPSKLFGHTGVWGTASPFHEVVTASPTSEMKTPKISDWWTPSHPTRRPHSTHNWFQTYLPHDLCSQTAIWYSQLLSCHDVSDLTMTLAKRVGSQRKDAAGTKKWLIINTLISTSCISPRWPAIPQEEPAFLVLFIKLGSMKKDMWVPLFTALCVPGSLLESAVYSALSRTNKKRNQESAFLCPETKLAPVPGSAKNESPERIQHTFREHCNNAADLVQRRQAFFFFLIKP